MEGSLRFLLAPRLPLERRAEGRAAEEKWEWSKDRKKEQTQDLHPATCSLPSWILDSFWKILYSKVGLEKALSGDVRSRASPATGQLCDWVTFLAGRWDSGHPPAPGLSAFTPSLHGRCLPGALWESCPTATPHCPWAGVSPLALRDLREGGRKDTELWPEG